MMKRAAIRRLGAWAIIVSNYSVRILLIAEKKFEEFCPLLRGEKDIIVNREDVLCPSLFCENQSVTGLCWSSFIDQGQAGICRFYPVSNFNLRIAIGYNDPCDKSIPQCAFHKKPHVLGTIVRQKHCDAGLATDGRRPPTESQCELQDECSPRITALPVLMSIVCGASYADTGMFVPDNQAVLAGTHSLVPWW